MVGHNDQGHDDESGLKHEPLPAALCFISSATPVSLIVPIFKMGRQRLRGVSWLSQVLAAGARGRCLTGGVPCYLSTAAAHRRAGLHEERRESQ